MTALTTLFKKPKVAPVQRALPPPSRSDDEVRKSVDELRKKRKLAMGTENTVLTSPAGDTSPVPGELKTLLGD